MKNRIAIVRGHPDLRGERYSSALADAYAKGATEGGHAVRTINVARLKFPLLRTKEEWESGVPPEDILHAQETIAWAGHLVIFYPLWLGSTPALLKAFLEQALRPGYAIGAVEGGKTWAGLLRGRSARIVVTMGMPALIYRWYFGAHSLKSLERNVLGMCGIKPIRETLIGNIEGCGAAKRAKWLERLRALGASAA